MWSVIGVDEVDFGEWRRAAVCATTSFAQMLLQAISKTLVLHLNNAINFQRPNQAKI
jgi:hypothetical protein